MDNSIQLGKLVPEGENRRDAVHVAIAPVVAKQLLFPAMHVGIDGSKDLPHVGIVDPYLRGSVHKGETFWLCLYPGTITSMRHVWSHPEFQRQSLKNERPRTAAAGH